MDYTLTGVHVGDVPHSIRLPRAPHKGTSSKRRGRQENSQGRRRSMKGLMYLGDVTQSQAESLWVRDL